LKFQIQKGGPSGQPLRGEAGASEIFEMTPLCVSIFVADVAQAKRDMALADEAGAEMIELRIDTVTDADEARDLVAACTKPCIVTCRPTWEGGRCDLSDDERMSLLNKVVSGNVSFMDIELEVFRRSPMYHPWQHTPVIVSSHDYSGRPTRLYGIIEQMNNIPKGVNKIVWKARSIRDNLEAFEILQHDEKPTIAFCMGEAGLISRVLAKKFGAFLTFASLNKDSATAPGQLTISEMKNLYRWDAIGPATKVYGVVAHPVGHSMSPAIHNAAFDQIGFDGVYLPMLVEPGYESFKAFMETFVNFAPLDLSGLSITLPHKENALKYLREKGAEVEELAAAIGAVNTIVIERSGGQPRLRGLNTDYAAILDSITDAMKISREQLGDLRVAVIGAGGTGRTAVAALAQCGATVVVYNRTRHRADALAEEFNGRVGRVVAADFDKLCDSCCQVYINATSAGMFPNVDQSPLGDRAAHFSDQTLVFDTIYNPMKTRLLKQAESAGAKTIGGVEMFLRQAAAQFKAWTGQPAPTVVMRRIIEKRLVK
jgi:3-dehydroquinate dehydratase / shikimate dehydrogenase